MDSFLTLMGLGFTLRRLNVYLLLTYRLQFRCSLTLRVQVPNNYILTQNLYYSYYYPNPKYPIIGYMDPLGNYSCNLRILLQSECSIQSLPRPSNTPNYSPHANSFAVEGHHYECLGVPNRVRCILLCSLALSPLFGHCLNKESWGSLIDVLSIRSIVYWVN